MTRFLLHRLAFMVPTLFGVSIVVFITVKITPGSPIVAFLGPTATPEAVEALRERLGLGHNVFVQYFSWLASVVQGDFGRSLVQQRDVLPLVLDAFLNTAYLAIYASILTIGFGIALGALSGLASRTFGRRNSTFATTLAVSFPQYTAALLLIVYVALPTGWFPVSGMSSASAATIIWSATLPAVAAALPAIGTAARTYRAVIVDVSATDYVYVFRAHGLPNWRIRLHIMYNALPSFLTVTGLQLGYLFGGIIFVEAVFGWPGIGLLLYKSILSGDLPVIQAGVLVTAVVFVLINFLVDTLHRLIDTRVTTS